MDYLNQPEKSVIQKRMDQRKGEIKSATDLNALAERLENKLLDQMEKAERQSPKSGGALWAAWRVGHNDLYQALATFEGTQGFGANAKEPGGVGAPTQLEIYEEKRATDSGSVWGKETGEKPMEDKATVHGPAEAHDAVSAYGAQASEQSKGGIHGNPLEAQEQAIQEQVAAQGDAQEQGRGR